MVVLWKKNDISFILKVDCIKCWVLPSIVRHLRRWLFIRHYMVNMKYGSALKLCFLIR